MNSLGLIHKDNGNIYEGCFKNGKIYGRGKITYSNGFTKECEWMKYNFFIKKIDF